MNQLVAFHFSAFDHSAIRGGIYLFGFFLMTLVIAWFSWKKNFQEAYNTYPRFHNWGHALQTFHSAVLMDTIIPLLPEVLEPIQTLAFFWAALAHDAGHRGKMNSFEIATQSDLAILYNDLSVLENHHASVCSKIMIKHDFLNHLPERGKIFRRQVVNSILGTDMSKHGNLLKKLQTLEICDDPELLITCCTHCADLGAQVLPISTAWDFYIRCTDEFMDQAVAEEELGLPVTPFMTGLEDAAVRAFGQVQFVEFVVAPLWKACSTALPTRSMLELEDRQGTPTRRGGGATKDNDVVEKKEPPAGEPKEISRSASKCTDKSEWIVNFQNNLEVYKFVAQNGKRREEMTKEELAEKGLDGGTAKS